MRYSNYKKIFFSTLLACLIPFTSALGDTYTDRGTFEAAVGSEIITVIDFEGWATGGGAAGEYQLEGNEFSGITLTAGAGAEGLFVGIPDATVGGDNCNTFYAADFIPTSGDAVFSPDDPVICAGSPVGKLIVDFDDPTTAVGVYFLDVEGGGAYIEAFDDALGTGNSLGIVNLPNQGDNSQAFAGITADGIKRVVLSIGAGGDGVGLDDLCFAKVEVTINIKPYSWPNAINTCSKGGTPLIIWGSERFDVSRIDQGSLSLGGMDVRVVGKKEGCTSGDFGQPDPEYVDDIDDSSDGYEDLKCNFITFALVTFDEDEETSAKLCFDYDANDDDVDGYEQRVCVTQEVFLAKKCEE